MNSIIYKSIISVHIIFCISSCNGQSTIGDCKTGAKNAKSNLNGYYENYDPALLNKALYYIEQSMPCKETRLQAVELKMSVLILLKEYKAGYEFIDSLQQSDFSKEYKKKMNLNIFKALEYEANADTVNAYKFYTEAINDLSLYIEKTNNDKQIDKDAYYDLYFLKSKVLSHGQMEDELEKLAEKYPSYKEFFTVLKSSFNSTK